tara:strand:- start:140 stop:595 length:456 start_codon:yes stop_codon:yes gene_type:complete
MKKVLLLLLFIPLISFGQNENTVNQNITIGAARTQGMSYLGDGVYIIKRKSAGFTSKKGLERKIREQIKQMTDSRQLNYEITNIDKYSDGSLDPNVEISFKLSKKDGTPFINKNEAKKQIIELKEFLDLGIITQEEFDTKVVGLKKILLGN